jgi:superfamily I DNA/RNA helicase
MTTVLADTFNAALARLNNDEQKQVKITVYDLQANPDQPGLRPHRIDVSKDPNFWSVRVNRDLRIIVHIDGDSLMLAYVGHHDDAYRWAERRRIETHPRTGAVQIVEVRERVEEVPVVPTMAPAPVSAPAPPPDPLLFVALSEDDLLSIGVPTDWLSDVKSATEKRYFELAAHLPAEASEALLEYAATGVLEPAAPPTEDPLAHPDSQRRFRVLDNLEELQAALDAPFEKWTVFLHPSQRGIVERDFSGPARVAGAAGTGKTVVALHRVQRIIRSNPDPRVLLTTFSRPLAESLDTKLKLLLGSGNALFDRVSIGAFDDIAAQLYALATGRKPHMVARETLQAMLAKAAEEAEVNEVTPQFLHSEWTHVIDAWQIETAEAYGNVPRMGRKNRLGPRQRERLWRVFGTVRDRLRSRGLMTEASLFGATAELYRDRPEKPFTHIVVDEAQDLGVAALRFLAAIAPPAPGALFFAGDLGQRIFQQPFSWKGLGVDVRGRSSTLRVNYRTSHQIRRAADRLLPDSIRDVDGLEDRRFGTISVFDGPEPEIIVAADQDGEAAEVVARLRGALTDGFASGEIGVFVRSPAQLPRAMAAVEAAGMRARTLLDRGAADPETVLVGTMHLAKGLEFRLVIVMACDEGVLPLAERVREVADDFELDEVLATERQLLYVAATRARDRLILSATRPASEFLEEFSEDGIAVE